MVAEEQSSRVVQMPTKGSPKTGDQDTHPAGVRSFSRTGTPRRITVRQSRCVDGTRTCWQSHSLLALELAGTQTRCGSTQRNPRSSRVRCNTGNVRVNQDVYIANAPPKIAVSRLLVARPGRTRKGDFGRLNCSVPMGNIRLRIHRSLRFRSVSPDHATEPDRSNY
jgi:hypothetical protein